jgi:ribosomal protein L21
MEEKIKLIEKMTKQIETENDFDKVIELFSAASCLVKEVLVKNGEIKGRVLEIIRDVDGYIEKEIKVGY